MAAWPFISCPKRSVLGLTIVLAGLAGAARHEHALANPLECRDLSLRYEAGKQSLADRQVNVYLMQAAQKGCRALAELLLKDGASVHTRRREGDTALHHAVKTQQPDVAKLLLDHGANIERRDLSGATPLFLAVEANRVRTVVLLLARGANPNTPGRSAASPLAAAAFNGNAGLVDVLLMHGAAVDAEDTTGKTALVYAAARGFPHIVKRLLAAGVAANRRYGNDLTALMWAAGHANDVPQDDGVKTVDLLVERGAGLDERDNRGRTALMIAAELGRTAIVEFLLARGAQSGLTDADGKTALDLAADDGVRAALAGYATPHRSGPRPGP
ncbi:MAG: ankyrin repeat domain-containing protein [Hyphomicrobiaceae bacterium]